MKKVYFLTLVSLLVFLGVSVYGGGKQEGKGTVLRVASSSEGPEHIAIYDKMIADFEAKHPGVTVTWDRSSGDDYQFQGLPSLLQSSTPPDIYSEWAGNRVKNHYLDHEAMDLSSLADRLRPIIDDSAWSGAVFDGKTYMIPTSQDVTIMMWYNVDIFNKLNLKVPKTWTEFLTVCAKIKEAGMTPILMGNSDAWIAGNFVGLFLYRWAGEQKTIDILSLKPGTKFTDPDFVKAMQFAYDLGKLGYINKDLNTLEYEPSFARLFDGSAVMYPLGTWFKTEIIQGIAPDPEKANFDFFNLPAMEGGKGDQSSYMGVNAGFMMNAKTKHRALAEEFLTMMVAPEYRKEFAKVGDFPSVKDTLDPSDSYAMKVKAMMNQTKTVVAPPDTGYNLEMSTALYQAMAKVLVNEMTPEAALAEVETKISHLRQ
ncbi:MAG TPA: ABC transporter substrate-binding protein [Spirochaetia bacterium]|nr:ABC transporter substrate-binding protein [Spirochaetia bacterium]